MIENVKMYLQGEAPIRMNVSEPAKPCVSELPKKCGRLKGLSVGLFVLPSTGDSRWQKYEKMRCRIGLAYRYCGKCCWKGAAFCRSRGCGAGRRIFFLNMDEVNTCVAALEKQPRLDNLADRVIERRAFNKKMEQITPPPMMPFRTDYGH
jgi:hypothetical protein